MIWTENACVDCQIPCESQCCPYAAETHSMCDRCGNEDICLFWYEGEQVCGDCILSDYEIVEGTEYE